MFGEGGRGKGEGGKSVGAGLPALITLLILPLAAQAAPLPEVVARVLEKHPDVRSAAALLRAADAAVTQARSAFFPTVGVQQTAGRSLDRPAGATTYGATTTRRAEAFVRWNLFNGYADYYGTRSAEYGSEAAASDLDEAREAVALRITEVYVEDLRLTEQMGLARDYLRDLERLMRDVSIRVEAGRLPAVELDQAESRFIRAQNESAQQQAQFDAAGNAFRQVTGMAPDHLAPPSLDEALGEEPLERLLARAEASNPKLQAARARVREKDADVGVATGELLPHLQLEARKRISAAPDSTLLSDQQKNEALQLSLEMPLGAKTWAHRTELQEKKLAAQADLDSKAIQMKSDLGDFHARLLQQRRMAPLLQRNLEHLARVVEAYRLQFSAGKRSLLDLLSVREDLYQAQTQEAGNRYDRLLMTARLEHLLGSLSTQLNPPRSAR